MLSQAFIQFFLFISTLSLGPCEITQNNYNALPFSKEYVVNKEIDLHHQCLQLPKGSQITFRRKGSFKNGYIKGEDVLVISKRKRLRFNDDVSLNGKNWRAKTAYVEWFGAKPDCIIDDKGRLVTGTDNYQSLSNLFLFQNVELSKGFYFYRGHLNITRSNQIINGHGAVFKNSFINPYKAAIIVGPIDAHTEINFIHNVTIKNLTIVGSKYEDTEKTEWAHGISIRNAESVFLEDVQLKYNKGDGLNITESYIDGRCLVPQRIHINRITADDNYRLGLSITGGDNVLVENSSFCNNKGTSPQSGVDIEPNCYTSQTGVLISSCTHIYFSNCNFDNNESNGILIQSPKSTSLDNIPVRNIFIKGCGFTNNPISLRECIGVELDSCSIKARENDNGIVLQNACMKDISICNTNILSTGEEPVGVGIYVIQKGEKSNLSFKNVIIEGPFQYGIFVPSGDSPKRVINGLTFDNIRVNNCWHNIFVGNVVYNAKYNVIRTSKPGRMKDGKIFKEWGWDIEKRDDIKSRQEIKEY